MDFTITLPTPQTYLMMQRTGIALGRLAYDADFSLTQFDFDINDNFLPPAHHRLAEAHTVEEILNTFRRLVGSDILGQNSFLVTIPISASTEQHDAFSDANRYGSRDHLDTWAKVYPPSGAYFGDIVNLLFIDLTPGQVASKVARRYNYASGYPYNSNQYVSTISLGDVISLSAQEIYDELVKSILPSEMKLHRVGILRPEGAFPTISTTDLEAMFGTTPVDWVTLDDLSHGAAIIITHDATWIDDFTFLDPPLDPPIGTIGITLSNGNLVKIVWKNEHLPTRAFIFTTSQDSQITVTVRVHRNSKSLGEVQLEGLAPRPKGQPRIKVTLNFEMPIEPKVRVGEIGTDLKKEESLVGLRDWAIEDYGIFNTYHGTIEEVEMTLGEDGVIGELPE
ncbi:hypothetical protein CPB86DRAFT_877995, partial [Serendipita vermifera]